MRVFGGEPVQATDDPDPRDAMASQAWVAVTGELGRIVGHIDEQIDPALRVIEAVVAGFHGIGPDADPEMAEMFAAGARDRDRILALEAEFRRLRQGFGNLAARVPT